VIRSPRLFLVLYAASGAAALVYEVTWTRLLALQLGHTVAAASTVLAAFMGGLALGAWLAGYTSAASLRAYAALELLVAATALLLPLALTSATPALAWAYADGAAPARFAIVRVVISLALLGVPAAAMGATFPIAAAWLASHDKGRASFSGAGSLYASNTAGAALGALAAGFWLIPTLGLRGTTWVGVGLNIAAAAGALWLSTKSKTAEPVEIAEKVPLKKPKNKSQRAPRSLRFPVAPAPVLACVAAAISGCAALIYEVSWTRLLALVIGPTTYAFATMAAAFISGLAIGSAIGARIARRVSRPAVWLAAMLVVSSVAASAAAWYAAARLPLRVAAEVADPAAAFGPVVATQAALVGLLLLPMTLALGATFPLALAAAGPGVSAGREAARVYASNTLGAIAGSLVAGFALIPRLGLQSTFQWTSIAGAAAGATCLAAALRKPTRPLESTNARKHSSTLREPQGRPEPPRRTTGSGQGPAVSDVKQWFRGQTVLSAVIVAVAAVAAVISLPPWDPQLLSSGAYKYAPYIGAADLDVGLRAGTLEFYKEGAAATVSVRRLAGVRALSIDGKVDASNGGDMLTQRLLGLLPVALHGRAHDICVIGLGSGVTLGSALAPGDVRHADVVEISPEVVEASHLFDRENGSVLAHPAVRLIVGDGRSHLLLTPRKYDVIISEPSNPWMAGVATLFTREFFEAARARLAPDGLLCQWAHTYDISQEDLQSIVRTFASVFPQGTMWLIGEADLLLIGGPGHDVRSRLDGLPARLRHPSTAGMLATVNVRATDAPFDLLSLYKGGPDELNRYGGNAVIQTDDRTRLEYSAPRGIYGKTGGNNAGAIQSLGGERPRAVGAVLDAATDASWASRGAMQLKAEAYELAYESFRTAVTLNSRNAEALAGLVAAAASARKQPETLEWLKTIASREPTNAPIRIELAHLYAAGGDGNAAIEAASAAIRLAPEDPRAAEQLASIVADAEDADRLEPLATSLAARFPDRPDPRYYQATVLFLRGRADEAIAAIRGVVDQHPDHARAQNLLGAACATLGRRECAQSAFEASLRADPKDPSTYINLGLFHLQAANPQEAARYFTEALSIDRQSEAARSGLAQARSALANPR
jgi:spermidine synthase